MLSQREGELRVRALQKAFLSWVESEATLDEVDPLVFNALRKRLFAVTFQAFRLGVIGVDAAEDAALWALFWSVDVEGLSAEAAQEVRRRYFRAALEAFRIGARIGPAHPTR